MFSVFVKRSGVVHLCYLESGKNINHETYIDDFLEPKFFIMGHPSYSPNLAPCDFWLFNYIKARLVVCSNAQSLSK